jgi:hypothetical protein
VLVPDLLYRAARLHVVHECACAKRASLHVVPLPFATPRHIHTALRPRAATLPNRIQRPAIRSAAFTTRGCAAVSRVKCQACRARLLLVQPARTSAIIRLFLLLSVSFPWTTVLLCVHHRKVETVDRLSFRRTSCCVSAQVNTSAGWTTRNTFPVQTRIFQVAQPLLFPQVTPLTHED